MIRRQITPEQALLRCATLCARSEHTCGEIFKKLLQWGLMPSDARKIIEKLVDQRFIDDERFARAFVSDKVKFARWGRYKIQAALAQKQVSREIIENALDDIDQSDYEEALKTVIAAKRRQLGDDDSYEARAKIFRYAASRGFETSAISKFLQNPFE